MANELYFEIKMVENGTLEYWNIGILDRLQKIWNWVAEKDTRRFQDQADALFLKELIDRSK